MFLQCILITIACVLFCVSSTVDYASTKESGVVGPKEQNNVVNGESLAKIVLDLQAKLVAQDRRIVYLEGRDKQSTRVLKTVTSRLTALENERHVQKPILGEKGNDAVKDKTYKHEYGLETGDIRNDDLTVTRNFKRQTIRQTAENVAFTSYLDHNVGNMGPGHTIKMNRVLLNDGNGYNSLTGIFTVPFSGVYMFNYHYNSHYHKTIIRLLIDGVEQVEAITSPEDDYEQMGGNTAVVRATQGQSVWLENIRLSDGDVFSDPHYRYCTFSGVLLY